MSRQLIDNSFPPTVRVCKKADFGLVFRQGNHHFSRCGRLLHRNNSLGFARFGVVVSKKTARLAVARNRIKRVARETFRQIQSSLPNQDIVFVAGKNCRQISNQELRQCIEKMLNRVRASQPSS